MKDHHRQQAGYGAPLLHLGRHFRLGSTAAGARLQRSVPRETRRVRPDQAPRDGRVNKTQQRQEATATALKSGDLWVREEALRHAAGNREGLSERAH